MAPPVPPPRAPLPRAPFPHVPSPVSYGAWCRRWYEDGLGWPTAAGPGPGADAGPDAAPDAGPASGAPVWLLTGVRFDVLEVPYDAGTALLRRLGPPACPVVALSGCGSLLRLLVAAGSAEELPGLLEWLEWGGIGLGLRALGAGGRMAAPVPAVTPAAVTVPVPASVSVPESTRQAAPVVTQGTAVWLRPPEAGREVERSLPALTLDGRGDGSGGSGGGAPGLVRLVAAAATECHRARLLRGNMFRPNTQPLAFS
ncbi:SCO3374 family protein [Streptomyces sp. NPDC093085]|uniref:SCO3374 family protein n=1 Tax=Streptomyces sp. NPDC093085 TaxID=3155068 RepID=UPI0034293053